LNFPQFGGEEMLARALAREICSIYGRPSQEALELAVRARKAAETLMDDEARTRSVGVASYKDKINPRGCGE
jgi:hypothetical protein